MTSKHAFIKGSFPLFSCLVLFAGCVAPTAESDPSSEATEGREASPGDDPENVAEAQEPLIACNPSYHHGGDLFTQDYEVVIGCACATGYTRDAYNVWNTGHGSCYAVRWETSDPHDCYVRVHIHDDGYWTWGDCNLTVTQNPACVHDKCTTGAPLTSGCSAAVTSICAADPYCCSTSWDSVCVGEVKSVAQSLVCPASKGTCNHTLCSTGPNLTSGCDATPGSSSCVSSICAVDPYCCNGSWDGICVSEVQSVCGKNCN